MFLVATLLFDLRHPSRSFSKHSIFLQESSSRLRHDLSSNDLNNNDNDFDDESTELGDRIVNLSNGFSQNSMSGTYQHQGNKKQVGVQLLIFRSGDLVLSFCKLVFAVTFRLFVYLKHKKTCMHKHN